MLRHFDQRDLHGISQKGAVFRDSLFPSDRGTAAPSGRKADRDLQGQLLFYRSQANQKVPREEPPTVMRFWVSVPVLSVQMTVVEPSVSTEGR